MNSLEKQNFTVNDGLAVQADNLAEWKLKLNEQSYQHVVDECNRQNKLESIKTGYNVFRGSDISTFIANLYR